MKFTVEVIDDDLKQNLKYLPSEDFWDPCKTHGNLFRGTKKLFKLLTCDKYFSGEFPSDFIISIAVSTYHLRKGKP